MKKRRINWETVFITLLFIVSLIVLSTITFSPYSLTRFGTVLLFVMILLATNSATYLYDRYELKCKKNKKFVSTFYV